MSRETVSETRYKKRKPQQSQCGGTLTGTKQTDENVVGLEKIFPSKGEDDNEETRHVQLIISSRNKTNLERRDAMMENFLGIIPRRFRLPHRGHSNGAPKGSSQVF